MGVRKCVLSDLSYGVLRSTLSVQHYPDPVLMQCIADLFKVLVGSQADIHLPVVPGIIAVTVRFKNGDLVNYLLESVRLWVEEFGIDGLRLDVAYSLDENFVRRLRSFCDVL